MIVTRSLLALLFAGCSSLGFAHELKDSHSLTIFSAAKERSSTLIIHGTADLPSIDPVIRGFQVENPHVEVKYRLYQSGDLYRAATSGEEPERADILVSSAVDLLVKLANDGFAQPHTSPATRRLPDWANWRNEVLGFTLEPAVIVYNTQLLPDRDTPRSHQDFIRIIERTPDFFRRRIATYDIGVSGAGYLFATVDSTMSANFWQLMSAFGELQVRRFCCTLDMLDAVARGEAIVAYNVLGSYALHHPAARKTLKIVIPEDYLVVVARAFVISRTAANPSAATRFVDYALSEQGQLIVTDTFGAGVIGSSSRLRERYRAESGGLMSPIVLGTNLLGPLDQKNREHFLRTWRQIISR